MRDVTKARGYLFFFLALMDRLSSHGRGESFEELWPELGGVRDTYTDQQWPGGAAGALLVYDITRRETFNSLARCGPILRGRR